MSPHPKRSYGAWVAMVSVLALHADAALGATYINERFGYSITVPDGVFAPEPDSAQGAGAAFRSSDGRARLLVLAAPNESGMTLAQYRRSVLEETYADAIIDYKPLRDTWFVLSGRKSDGSVFYERISFVCGGRYIYGWRMTYPAAQARLYDRLVETVHRGFRPGRGQDGRCGP